MSRLASAGPSRRLALVCLALLAALALVVALFDWRTGLYLFLAWLVFEDLPRKFLGNSLVVYFGKDVLAAAVFVGFILARRGRPLPQAPRFVAPLAVFAGVAAIGILNPRSPSPLYGLLGLKVYFYYVPLFLIGWSLVRDEWELRRFLSFNLCLAGVVALLGMMQAVVGLDFLNPATTPEHLHLMRLVRQSPLSGKLVARPTSVFVSDGRFAWYMLLTLWIGLGALAYGISRGGRIRLVAGATLALVTGAILLSGSRGTFMYALASLLVFLGALGWGVTRGAARERSVPRTFARAAATVGLAVVVLGVAFPDAVGARWAFYYETIAPWSPSSELFHRLGTYSGGNLLAAFQAPGWLLGYGTGINSLGAQYLQSVFAVPPSDFAVESGYGSLVLEIGIPGLLAWLAWTVALVAGAWRVVRSLRGSPLFPMGFAIFWFALILLFPQTYGGLAPYQNYVFNAYLWLLIGVLWSLPDLDRVARREATTETWT